MTNIQLLITAAAAATAIAPVWAQTITQTVAVPYAGLDLGTVAGQATLERRVRVAVNRVCGPVGRSLVERSDFAKCRRKAAELARTKLEFAVARYRAGAGVSVAAR